MNDDLHRLRGRNPRFRLSTALGIAGGILTVALLVCWLAQAFALVADSRSLGRWLLPAWLLAVGVWGALRLRACLVTEKSERRVRRRVLLLLALALLVRIVGADHEVGERAYRDEGTYYHHANEINRGNPWRWSFVYGHFSYYTGALALWTSELFPDVFHAVARAWTGTSEELAHRWLVLRGLVALLSALTVLPVFGIARRILAPRAPPGGSVAPASSEDGRAALTAATAAGLLYTASPIFNAGSHLIISDYPSACLATFCLWCVACFGLGDGEDELDHWRAYLGAGAFSGLAAATKYPAGTVAAAIVFAWAAGCWIRRRLSVRDIAALALSGGVSLALFLGVMPTFFRDPSHAIQGRRGMLFGFRQYSGGGWIGVQPESQLAWYLSSAAEALGWVALAVLVAAPFLLRGPARRRWSILAFFPVAYFLLLVSMNMAVERNLAPAIPVAAALAGVGLAALAERIPSALAGPGPTRHALTATVVVVALLGPSIRLVPQVVGLARDSTREHAARWMIAHLPEGSRVLRESYTPRLPPEHFFLRRARFAARVPLEEIEGENYKYVLLSANAYGRFLREELRTEEHHDVMAERYREMFDRYREVRTFEPGRWRQGPHLVLLEVVPGDRI